MKPPSGTKYSAALGFLRKPAPMLKENEKTYIDIYIEKQRAFGEAQSELEAVLIMNSG